MPASYALLNGVNQHRVPPTYHAHIFRICRPSSGISCSFGGSFRQKLLSGNWLACAVLSMPTAIVGQSVLLYLVLTCDLFCCSARALFAFGLSPFVPLSISFSCSLSLSSSPFLSHTLSAFRFVSLSLSASLCFYVPPYSRYTSASSVIFTRATAQPLSPQLGSKPESRSSDSDSPPARVLFSLSSVYFFRLAAAFALRQRMLNFVQNLQYYMAFEVG